MELSKVEGAHLITCYRKRLLIPDDQELQPTRSTLNYLIEKHLSYCPFENTAFHRKSDEHIKLKLSDLVKKVLIDSRGGCCLELNGIFAYFLTAIGFHVSLVPCYVYAGAERGHNSKRAKFRTTATHFVLFVNQTFIVDVGLGEPPMCALQYTIDAEQLSVDGLVHRFVRDKRKWVDRYGNERECIILEWCIEDQWIPRLQWSLLDAPLSGEGPSSPIRNLNEFEPIVSILKNPKSTFAQKLIVCTATRDIKKSLSGRSFKVTRRSTNTKVIRDLTDAEVIDVLQNEFKIKLNDLDLTKSDSLKRCKAWIHL